MSDNHTLMDHATALTTVTGWLRFHWPMLNGELVPTDAETLMVTPEVYQAKSHQVWLAHEAYSANKTEANLIDFLVEGWVFVTEGFTGMWQMPRSVDKAARFLINENDSGMPMG
jgi:hypothetical protein